jgi:hypothetical protein
MRISVRACSPPPRGCRTAWSGATARERCAHGAVRCGVSGRRAPGGTGQGADHRAEAAAVNGSEFSQMQDDGAMERRSRNNQATCARSDSLSPPATIRPLRCTIVTPPRSRVSSERRNVFKNAAESKPAKSPCYMPRGAPEAEWFPATSKVGLLKQDDRDSAILASEVRIAFEFGVRSKKFPGQVI